MAYRLAAGDDDHCGPAIDTRDVFFVLSVGGIVVCGLTGPFDKGLIDEQASG